MNILLYILVSLAIVVAVALIVVLTKLYQVLLNLKVTSDIAKRRVVEADIWIEEARKNVNSFSDVVRGFIVSLNSFANLSGKIKEIFHRDDEKSSEKEEK